MYGKIFFYAWQKLVWKHYFYVFMNMTERCRQQGNHNCVIKYTVFFIVEEYFIFSTDCWKNSLSSVLYDSLLSPQSDTVLNNNQS